VPQATLVLLRHSASHGVSPGNNGAKTAEAVTVPGGTVMMPRGAHRSRA
jgi:hypothetical protein